MLALPFFVFASASIAAPTSAVFSLPSALPTGNPRVDTIWFRYFSASKNASLPFREGPGVGPAPAVVILPPLGSDDNDPMVDRLADYLSEQGIASAILTLPYHGPRHADKSKPAAHFAGGNVDNVVHAYRQSVSDAQTVADWLRARPEIDPTRIGIVGISLGAIITHLAMGEDPRFTVGVAILGAGDLPDLARDSIVARVESMTRPLEYTPDERALVRLVDPLTYAGNNRPRKVLMIQAARDMFVPPRDAVELWNALGRPPIRWIDTNHIALSLAPEAVFGTVSTFLLHAWAGDDVHGIRLPPVDAPTIKIGVIVEDKHTPAAAVQWQVLPIGHRPDHMSLLALNLGLGDKGPFAALGVTVTPFVDAGLIENGRGGPPRRYLSFHFVF